MQRSILLFFLFHFSNVISSSITVLGNGSASLCYQAASTGRSGQSSINTCLLALRDEVLSAEDRSATQINLGIVFNNSFLPNRALQSFERAGDFEKLLPEITLNSGNSYFIKMQFFKAIEHYSDSIDQGIRDQSAAFYNTGLAYEMLKDMNSAVKSYKKAISLKPDPVYFEKKSRLIEGGYWSEK